MATGRSGVDCERVAASPRIAIPPSHASPAIAVASLVDTAASPEWLVDNADTCDRIIEAIGSARHSIWIMQSAFDADCVAYGRHATVDRRPCAPPGGTTILAEGLLAAAMRAPVDVRVLLNATWLVDTARPLRRFFAARLAELQAIHGAVPGTVDVRGVNRFPQFLHAKMVVVDRAEAFLLGSPFANGYWDDERHPPVDRRRPLRELGGRPLHDLSIRVTGSTVATLEHIFAALWDSVERPAPSEVEGPATASVEGPAPSEVEGPTTASVIPQARRSMNDAVTIACTSPRRAPGAPRGSMEILALLLEGIERARACIYVEHQYLSARPVAAALARALARSPALELIVVLNQNADVTAYRRWQNARLAESGLLAHPRVGLFALWSVALDDASPRAMINQVFIHSKVVVVDDEWATAGSANLDGVSLHSYGDDFTSRLARRIFRDVRNFEINVVVDDRREGGEPSGTAAAGLRTRLWSEHLGMPEESLTTRPAGGWLPLWRARAAANVAALGAATARDTVARIRGLVLPYSVESTPAGQLADLGVRVDPARLEVCFNPGWLEVHLSPNWVRNMFS